MPAASAGDRGGMPDKKETPFLWKFSSEPQPAKKPTGLVAALGGVRREDLDLSWA